MARRRILKLLPCVMSVHARPEFARELLLAGATEAPTVQNLPNGCEKCDLTGYKGRVGIYEMLAFDEAIRAAIRDGGNSDEIRGIARRSGMKLMHEYAIEQVRAGITTLAEVERVVPIERIKSLACPGGQRALANNFVVCPYCV